MERREKPPALRIPSQAMRGTLGVYVTEQVISTELMVMMLFA